MENVRNQELLEVIAEKLLTTEDPKEFDSLLKKYIMLAQVANQNDTLAANREKSQMDFEIKQRELDLKELAEEHTVEIKREELEAQEKIDKRAYAKIAEQGGIDLVNGVAKIAVNCAGAGFVALLGMWAQAKFGTIIPKDILNIAMPFIRKPM